MMKKRKLYSLLLLYLLSFACLPGQDKQADTKAGEKLFFQLSNQEGETCADCHYFVEPDSINWNPSAHALAERSPVYAEKGISSYFGPKQGKVMEEAHSGYNLSGEEEDALISYLVNQDPSAPVPKEGFKMRRFLFIALFVLMILLGIEKRRIGKVPVLVRKILNYASIIVIITLTVQNAISLNRSHHYSPVQPIKFSHKIHSTDNQIDCYYCHPGVIRGRNAGFPAVSLCMNCHKHVKEGTRTGSFEIRKINQAYEDSVHIRWVRVHNLPDYTYFNHYQHVEIGEVECITCHGDVENRHIIEQVEDLSMGWCIDCHDKTPVDFSNDYYKTYFPALLDSLQTGKIDSVMVSDIGGRECGKCHY